MTQLTCNKCRTVAFGVTRKSAQIEVEFFNNWFEKQPDSVKALYGGKPSSIQSYEQCMFCAGPYTNFRPSVEGDCPDGCTLSPIIYEEPKV